MDLSTPPLYLAELAIQQLIKAIVPEELRGDVNLEETPERVAKAFMETWCAGYQQNLSDVVTLFPNEQGTRDLVLVKDIPFYSMCSHHLALFSGKAMIAYVPGKQVLGLSKTSRILDVFARRLQLQERITQQVADGFMDFVKPLGVMVVLYNVEHTCMTSRGVKAHEATTTTSAVRGLFDKDSDLRHETLMLLNQR